MGVEANLRISEEKGPFPPFSGFSRCSSHPPEKGEKGRKRAKKADFGRFPGRSARHPLSPQLLHPHLRQPNIGFLFSLLTKECSIFRLSFQPFLAVGSTMHRSPETLWGRNSQRVSKRSSRASRPGMKKNVRER